MTTTKKSYFDMLDELDRIDAAIRFCRVAMRMCQKHDMMFAYAGMREKLIECQTDRAELVGRIKKRANTIREKYHRHSVNNVYSLYYDSNDCFNC